MRRSVPLLLATAFLGLAAAVPATPDLAPDELEHNRRLLDRYRADPAHYDRLLRDLRAFETLPAARQERMRQFDHDLHEEDPATQNRLWEVLERYTDWVNRLPEADQKRVDAAGAGERLAIVQRLRQREWLERLPKKDRDELQALQEPDLAARVAALHKEERQRRQEWFDWANGLKAAPRPHRPASNLPDVPQRVLEDFRRHELGPEGRANLKAAGDDPAERREVLKQEYFKKYPDQIERWRRVNRRSP